MHIFYVVLCEGEIEYYYINEMIKRKDKLRKVNQTQEERI